MLRVVHFEIGADDTERATAFYQKVFDWKIKKWEGPEPYWLITTGEKKDEGIDGGISKRHTPDMRVVNIIDVPSVKEYLDKVIVAGGEVISEIMTIPKIGYLAYCIDTEGNTFGIMENDEKAE